MGTMKFKKKNQKNMGRRTHGYGNCQGHRKTGHKGGHGLTNHWKKTKKSYLVNLRKAGYPDVGQGKNRENPWIIGKHGFQRPAQVKRLTAIKAINIGSVNTMVDKWVEQKLAEKSGNSYTVDLAKVGYNKLLARGSVNKKLNIKVYKASNYAVEEIENAGGQVTVEVANKKEI